MPHHVVFACVPRPLPACRFGRVLCHLDQLFLAAAANAGLLPWPSDWDDRGLGLPPDDGIVKTECGLLGLVPPVPRVPAAGPPSPPRPPSAGWTAVVLDWQEKESQQKQGSQQQQQRSQQQQQGEPVHLQQ